MKNHKEQENTNNELREELWKDNFIAEMVAFEELTKDEDKAIERPKFILDLVSLTLQQREQQLKAELLDKIEEKKIGQSVILNKISRNKLEEAHGDNRFNNALFEIKTIINNIFNHELNR